MYVWRTSNPWLAHTRSQNFRILYSNAVTLSEVPTRTKQIPQLYLQIVNYALTNFNLAQ